ncbi:unnamed protein product [Cercopithifilaria johnstoni]|uniref:Uncharacterized protein n=1 Tax=Cercopithifilaria johnstoni TaxID=2874296 RepID=A0A8J2LW56_9BILA|nr:unnamed protein product [Cercopithifilaria johnstoni]
MDRHYSYRERRFRPHPRIPQERNQLYKSSELDYTISGTGAEGGVGSYFGTSGPGYFGAENQPRRSRSLDNRKDWLFSDDYGFPAIGTDERYNGATKRYQSHQQRNYNYQPYLSVNTGHRGTYDGRRGNDHYFDNLVTLQSNPTESDWDALDRSIRNYREDPGGATIRHSKVQNLSPVRPSGVLGGHSGGTKSKRHNLPSYICRHCGTGGGFGGPQNGISVSRNESIRGIRNDFPSGSGLQDEMEFGANHGVANYYRGSNSNHQQSEYYGPSAGPANVTSTTRGRTMIRGATAGTTRYGLGEQKYYKFHCCCLSFRWPPWAFEEVEPPQSLYRRT